MREKQDLRMNVRILTQIPNENERASESMCVCPLDEYIYTHIPYYRNNCDRHLNIYDYQAPT